MNLQSLYLSSDLNPTTRLCVNRSVGGQFQPDQWLREPQKVSYCSSSMCWVPLGLSLACLCLPFVSARFSFSPSPPPTPNQSHYLPRHRREVSQSEATNRLWSEDRPLPGTVHHRRGQVSSESPFQGPTGPGFSGLVGSPLSRPHLPTEDGSWSLFSSSTPSLSDLGQLTSPLCDCFRPLKNKTITPTHRIAGSTEWENSVSQTSVIQLPVTTFTISAHHLLYSLLGACH